MEVNTVNLQDENMNRLAAETSDLERQLEQAFDKRESFYTKKDILLKLKKLKVQLDDLKTRQKDYEVL